MLPVLIMTALINPLFNHEGITILMYLPDGNPLTLESVVYGGAAALMLVTVISWFSCYNAVMTSDKFVYLFGRVIPALSLILSMSLRFIPRFNAHLKAVSNAQKCVGRDMSNGGLLKRAKNGILILSIMVTWALENAIETSDSMKSRGYGLQGRTAFSLYRFDRRDMTALIYILLCVIYIIIGAALNGLYFSYFPVVQGEWNGAYTVSLFAVYFALAVLPLTLNIKESQKWKTTATKSKI
jgi:energy-coupling factor transport system permease protein